MITNVLPHFSVHSVLLRNSKLTSLPLQVAVRWLIFTVTIAKKQITGTNKTLFHKQTDAIHIK